MPLDAVTLARALLEAFPGAELVDDTNMRAGSPQPLSGRPGPGSAANLPAGVYMTLGAVNELVEAVDAMVGYFAAKEPGRLDRPGFQRLMAASAAVKKKPPEIRQVGLPPGDPTRMARGEDPLTSKIAARRVAPTVGSRQAEVLARLQEADGGWVSGSELSTAECGGSEGKRRLRELREDRGWPIESRPDPGSDTAWSYRLAEYL